MFEAKVVSIENLPSELKEEYTFWDTEYRQVLIVVNDGKVIAHHLSGGEPEDNSFGRDYAWVAPLINKAYQLGKESK